MEYVGAHVAKRFPGFGTKKFKGTVVATNELDGEPFWSITYEDGDEEDVGLEELQRIMVPRNGGRQSAPAPQQRGRQQKRKAAEQGAATAAAADEEDEQQQEQQPQQPQRDRASDEEAEKEEERQQRQPRRRGRQQLQEATPEQQQLDTAAGTGKRRATRSGQQAEQQAEQQAGVLSGSQGLSEQLRGVVEQVAAKSVELELDVRRYSGTRPVADPAARHSHAVVAGGLCYTSALRPVGGKELPEDAAEELVVAEYRSQTEDVLSQLDGALREAGTSREHLVQVTALLKDLPMGREAFAAAWNAWVPPAALPALAVLESYLGREDLCVSVHAVAAVPSRPAYT